MDVSIDTRKLNSRETTAEERHSFLASGYATFLCSTQLSMNFVLPINLKLLTIANSFLLSIVEHANKYENANRCWHLPLRKHAYSNILKILPSKSENFQIKNSDIFHVSAQNIDCGYLLEPPHRGGSEYPQSMFLSRNKENNVYPCKPQFCYIKVGFKGVKII